MTNRLKNLFVGIMPGLFVVLWATGFIGAKLGLPYAEPFTFLALRFSIVVAILVVVALATNAPWPTTSGDVVRNIVVGLLVHGLYLGGIFAAIDRGLPSSLGALIVGLQPLLTAVAVEPFLGERVNKRQWCGLILGLVGVFFVLMDRLAPEMGDHLFDGFDSIALIFAFLALLGITAGTLIQKRFGGNMDLRTGTAIQYAAAAAAMGLVALMFENRSIEWTGEFVFALGWLVVILSLGAISLLMTLIRLGEASRVASLFYLVPPVTALMAYFIFNEQLGQIALFGMGLAVVGVALVIKK